jgi:hypothetical protein
VAKNKISKEYKIFVASASDCEELRKETSKVITELAKMYSGTDVRFRLYEWEEEKKAEFIKSGERYQDKIFKEFGEFCDIFIIFFWTKLGAGTVEEYEFFKTTFVKKNKNIKFLGFHYNKPMTHGLLEKHGTYYDLLEFLKVNEKDWAPLGRKRRAINNKNEYETELRTEIGSYILNQERGVARGKSRV